MSIKLSGLTAALSAAIDVIFHLRTTGGIDKKITQANLFASDLILAGDNTFSGENEFTGLVSKINIAKSYLSIALTHYSDTTVPAIVVNSILEINGSIYTNPSEVAISGATSNSTWYDILLTPSGTTFTASFIARGTGVWSDSKQGLYSGNNRVVACVWRNASAEFINKNILIVDNRTVKIKTELGSWNMDTSRTITVELGIVASRFIGVNVIIYQDDGNSLYPLYYRPFNDETSGVWYFVTNAVSYITIGSLSGASFDNANFNDTTINRGHLLLNYKV